MIEDEVHRKINQLRRQYEMLSLYVDAELSGSESEEVDSFEQISPSDDDIHNDSFELEGEAIEFNEALEYLQQEEYPDPDEEIDESLDAEER